MLLRLSPVVRQALAQRRLEESFVSSRLRSRHRAERLALDFVDADFSFQLLDRLSIKNVNKRSSAAESKQITHFVSQSSSVLDPPEVDTFVLSLSFVSRESFRAEFKYFWRNKYCLVVASTSFDILRRHLTEDFTCRNATKAH